MHILITGGAGFIGTQLTKHLLKQGHMILTIDLKEFESLSEYHFHKVIDLSSSSSSSPSDIYNLIDICEHYKIEGVIHLASPIGVNEIINYPLSTFKEALKINTCIDELCTVLELPILYTSSSEVYGNSTDNDIYRTQLIENSSRSTYSIQKMQGEALFHLNHKYKSTIFRLFNIVGETQITEGMIFPTFIKNALENTPLFIKENGIRNYCHVQDIMIFFEEVITSWKAGEAGEDSNLYNKKIYDIGNPNPENKISAYDLAQKIILCTPDSKSNIIVQSAVRNDFPERELKYLHLVNLYPPEINLDEIIIRQLQAHQSTNL